MPPKHPTEQQIHVDPVENEREFLLTLDSYLGTTNTENLRNNVAWHHIGNADYLFTQESINAHAAEENEEEKPDLQLANLSVIAHIPQDSCFVKPDGNWQGAHRTKFNMQFKDIKLTFLGIAPETDVLKEDFQRALHNVHYFSNKVGGLGEQHGSIENDRLKFRHVLFKVSSITLN